jgi:hypothetical protein
LFYRLGLKSPVFELHRPLAALNSDASSAKGDERRRAQDMLNLTALSGNAGTAFCDPMRAAAVEQ